MSILNKAFCCFQLSTTGVLLGWLGGVGYFFTFVTLVVGMARLSFSNANNFKDITWYSIFCVTILATFLNLVGCICLMVGTIKKIRHLILPWLYGQIAFIIVLTIACMIGLVKLIEYGPNYILTPFCILTTFLAFQIYFWLCVYSLFQMIRDEDIKKLGVETQKSHTLNDNLPPYSSFA